MAKHDVEFTIPKRPLGRADVQFAVKRDGKPFGRLKISNGTLVWVKGSATYGYEMPWATFADLMEKHGKHQKQK
ncbi:MAG: hypothetical protein HY372_02460 [Candidatus Andersenbacteria bacterium]|nr:hypothetical protein [Candidatus Andersenbacteria bacterium]